MLLAVLLLHRIIYTTQYAARQRLAEHPSVCPRVFLTLSAVREVLCLWLDMTRILSELLGAREPDFHLHIAQLERASGAPSADIRLTSDLLQKAQAKIRELGLDPSDTTGPELFSALEERLKADETRVRESLHISELADSTSITSGVLQFVRQLSVPKTCYGLKHAVAKRILKGVPPLKAMQRLGYRSLDSFLKHEPVANIYAAAWASESAHWRRDLLEAYHKLQPGDFEPRKIEFSFPRAKRWEKFAAQLASESKIGNMYFQELGAIVLLPLPEATPAPTLLGLLFTLFEINEIRCSSAFFKLQQVRPDFGKVVARVVDGQADTMINVAGQPVPWRLLQRYYGSNKQAYRPELFEPHVQADDLEWHHAETDLAQAIPALEFWHDTVALGMLDNDQAVSFNIFDVALGLSKDVSFKDRVLQFLRGNLWHELMLRYLHQSNVEEVVIQQLDHELAGESLASGRN